VGIQESGLRKSGDSQEGGTIMKKWVNEEYQRKHKCMPERIAEGTLVQLKANPEGQHYTLDRYLNAFTVDLSYKSDNGERVHGGTCDITLIEPVPTKS
jgi:hypothetical protein